MFVLAEMRDMVRVPPVKFNLPLEQAITEELDRKLANKVVLNVGLCICTWDLVKMGLSYTYPGDGASHTRTTFNYIVFRPFIDEIIEGEVMASSMSGLQVSLGFFSAIFIKPENMMADSYYDETEKVWIWNYQEEHKLFMDVGQKIRVRVISEKFFDTTPSGPQLAAESQATAAAAAAAAATPQSATPAIIAAKDPLCELHPYTIYASINGPGLGMLSWWAEDGDDEEEEEEGGETNGGDEEVDGGEGEHEEVNYTASGSSVES